MARKAKKNTTQPSALPFEQPIEDVRTRLLELEELSQQTTHDLSEELEFYRERLTRLTEEVYSNLTPWNRVQVARHPKRPLTGDYIQHLCEDFVELHGDGSFGDDQAIVTGLATIRGHQVMVIGHRKGRNTKERLACHFGSAHPEGYRKALLKMQLAERMGLPIICFVNTPGAYPGVGAEERGQARAIAENIYKMFQVRVPIIALLIGDGGSGGALGIAIADRVTMLENSWYSVISPEGCASILWRSAEGKEKAAEALKLTAESMHELGLVDEIVPEPTGGAHAHPKQAMDVVGGYIAEQLTVLGKLSIEDLLALRYEKFRQIAHTEAKIQKQAVAEAQQEAQAASDPSVVVPGEPDASGPVRRTPGSPRSRRRN
jgi:acetyl-CoA carboxylase carboxyl transferase subunit alpha